MANNAQKSSRRQLVDEIFERIESAGMDAPTFSADEYLDVRRFSPYQRSQIAALSGLDLGNLRLTGRDILNDVRSWSKDEAFLEEREWQLFEMVTERGAVVIGPSSMPGLYSLFVVAGAYDYETTPGEMRELPALFETEYEAAERLAEYVSVFLQLEFGTTEPRANRITRPHLTIIGGMLKALAAVDFIPEHPNTLREPPHLMALQSLDDLRKRYPYRMGFTRQ
ncbi:hypothetical protein [Sinorhizobium meliloti]|uniref:hypothetical protein n=1 Tax=Rhizobium meliloti TaxID=382 RepID=UPI000FDC9052|nr:hypothetical protein [Sinorhizobium meliloti]RVK34259.1 hypothetical protein CN163_22445 [Sinorhizobium meliloti]